MVIAILESMRLDKQAVLPRTTVTTYRDSGIGLEDGGNGWIGAWVRCQRPCVGDVRTTRYEVQGNKARRPTISITLLATGD